MTDAYAIAHKPTKVLGGIIYAMIQTSMVSTMVEHIRPMLMVHMERILLLPQIHRDQTKEK